MSIIVTFNGANYIIPTPNEVGWGTNLDNYFVAIAAGALQKTGGLFTLSADADFGSSFGLKSLYYKSRSASVSSTGILRLANNSDAISWRNFLGSGDLPLAVNTSNQLTFNGTPIGGSGIFTANRAIISDGSGNLTASPTTSTEISYVNGVTSAIQTQLNNKASIALDNLASTAVNTEILPATDNTGGLNLGSITKAFNSVFAGTLNAGHPGLSGALVIYPTTTARGVLEIAAANNTGNTTTLITNAQQAGARTYTIPDAGTDASFLMSEGSQTINGSKIFSSAVTITPTTNQLILGTTRTVTLNAPTPATSSRTWTIPDITANGTFAALEGTQTFSGSKTFTSSILAKGGVSIVNNSNNAFELIAPSVMASQQYLVPNALPLVDGAVLSSTTLGTMSWASTIAVANGGTGNSSFTAFQVLTAGITSTAPLTSIALGSSGQVLTSNGAGSSPTFQNVAGTGTVNSGTAGRLSLYNTSTNAVTDTYVQNTKNIVLAIATQATRSADIAYTVPNPGDAVTAASFVLTEGTQTINGLKSFSAATNFNYLPATAEYGVVIGETSPNISSNSPLLVLNRSISQGDVLGNPEIEIINFNTGSARVYIQTGNVAANARALVMGNIGPTLASPGTWWSSGPNLANSLFIQEDRNGSYSQTPATFVMALASLDNYFRSSVASSNFHFVQNTTDIFTIGGTSHASTLPLAMGSNKITGLANASADSDAMAYGQRNTKQSLVFASTTTTTSTTSSTFTNTSLAATITPTSASSRIKITVTGTIEIDAANKSADVTIKRGSTNIMGTQGGAEIFNAGGAIISPCSLQFVDSPATTSATTYTVAIRSEDNATNCKWGDTNVTTTILLEEII